MQTQLPAVTRPAPSPPTRLAALDPETVRVPAERAFATRVTEHPIYAALASKLATGDARDIRRRLMADSLRLSDSMAPEAHQRAREAQRVLGIQGELEIFQRSGVENASIHLVEAPILLEVQGPLLSLLDAPTLLGLFGHELGHYLAHGPKSPLRGPLSMVGLLGRVELDRSLELPLSHLAMLAELTADRFGLLACQDLHAMLRLEMVAITGLASGALTWDTDAYLAQSRDVVEAAVRDGTGFFGRTHPEHNLRSYALWLFSETRTFRELTGRGPGTRDLAEVNALLATFFPDSPSDGELVLDYSRLGEPPRELHESALAAAVIVAHADGELTDDEVSAIERCFAPLVPDWRTFLDREVALARFHELAPVLAAGGPDLARALFQLLVHVMGADGVIDEREVQVILAIGRAVGAEPLFRSWLGSTLSSLRVQVSITTAVADDLPMPAGRQEVADAVDSYLRAVARRGETTTTLRRLLRLLGYDRRSPEAVARLAALLRAHGVEASEELGAVGLDQRLRLVAPLADVVEKARPSQTSRTAREALIGALRRLREQLVSGDGRSPSVRLRRPRRGRAFDLMDLESVSVGLAERVLAQVKALKTVRVVDAASAGRHTGAQGVAAELLALAREDASRFEETGAHDLFVGYPFVIGKVAGYAVRAPLVLYPVEIERDGPGARGFRLKPRTDEPAIANQSVIRLLFNKRGFAYSDELSDQLEELAGDPDEGPDAVRRRLTEVGLATAHLGGALARLADRDAELLDRPDFLEVEECAVVGLFPQSSSDLLQDYDGLIQELSGTQVNVPSLLAAASVLLPEGLVGTQQKSAAPTDATSAPVISADPAQRRVIAACRKHGATVVDGPPGTGKSQVIVNLVAEALGRGERVAVVCEKRAALDVVRQRLSGLGFQKTLAVVHDVQEDRKPLFEQIAARLEETDASPFDAQAAERALREHQTVERSLEARAAALRTRPPGLDLTVAELMTLAASLEPARFLIPDSLARLPQASLRELLDRASDLHGLLPVWQPGSPWLGPRGTSAPPRPSLGAWQPRDTRELAQRFEEALAAARAYEQLAASSPVDAATVASSRAAIELAAETRALRDDADARALFGHLLPSAADAPERLASADVARATWDETSAVVLRVERPVQLDASDELVAALSVLRRWSGSWVRFFVLGWWTARAKARGEVTRLWPEKAGAVFTPQLLEELADRIAASRAWQAIGRAFDALSIRHLLPATADALGATVGRLARVGAVVQQVATAREPLARAHAWPVQGGAADLARWDETLAERQRLLRARDALLAAAAPVARAFPWLGELPRAEELAALLEAWRRDGERVVHADALFDRGEAAFPAARALLASIATHYADASQATWRSAILAGWADAWIARLEVESPALGALGSAADDRELTRAATRLAELEEELRELAIEGTLAQVDQAELLRTVAAEKHQRRTAAQKVREEILKETRKKRRLLPLRSFVRRYAPSGLLGVVPVWLLSPETMAILFPRQALFDLVIFDEASQCTVEAGLPVLLRARRVVIAGDEKQMPPSSYFSLGAGGDDEADAGAPDGEDQREVRDMLGAESLLTLARTRCAHAGLAWHYRCRDEALIAFSNHAMYRGSLLTIPGTASPGGPSPIQWVHVPGGVYDAGENLPEAERVVDVVHELLRRTPRPSVGVVTFNLKQRKAVLDAVESRALADPDFGRCWTEATSHDSLDERPFIKNLEQVQGDERDVIVFSLGHAPQDRKRKNGTTERYVPARFGPLGQRGGERRLNVAISRAKTGCCLVSSFEPVHLTVASARNEGPRLFKQFLEFAHHMHHGRRLDAARVLDLVRETRLTADLRTRRPAIEGFVPVATQLALALEEAGVPHETDVGASSFKIPVAVLDPADPTRFALAILFDDADADASTFDLHVHRRAVLRTRGWQVLTLHAASWYRRGSEIVEEIEALVPGARGALRNDVYTEYRARRASAAAPAAPAVPAVAAPTAPPPAAEPRQAAPPPVDDGPSWAAQIEDRLFRKVLLHLERHGQLTESDLVNLVGGPRRARQFARESEGWRDLLPFGLEVIDVGGSKVYRNTGARA